MGTVAGCYVQDGKIQRKDCQVRLVRDGIVIHEGVLASLQRFKDQVKEVASGYECGMTIEKFNDIKEGDIIEAFTMDESLIQEFNREANTIGSKCQNADIAKVVVDLKSEIEKIREQIQNIE